MMNELEMNYSCYLKDNEVHIWKIYLNLYSKFSDDLYDILSEDEKIKANQFIFQKECEQYILCRGFLRKILGKYLQIKPETIKFCYNLFGKPYLEDSSIQFNLSHSSQIALIVITKGKKIGIDIEDINKFVDTNSIKEYLFLNKEIDWLHDINLLEDKELILGMWTKFEARYKAKGHGIYNKFNNNFIIPSFEYTFKPHDNYVASLYVEGNIEHILFFSN